MQNKLFSYRDLFLLFIISLSFFSFKWILSFYFFGSEDLVSKIIHDSSFSKEAFDSYSYFHYVKSLADFDFTSLYNQKLTTNYLISSPYGSIIIHALLFKLIGPVSFIISEFIFITLFFLVFFLIFRLIYLSRNISILLSVICFLLPIIFYNLNYFGIIEIKTLYTLFYGLRFPRPLVVNIYFYIFIYTLLRSHLNKDFFSTINVSVFSVLLALTASSFFFFFINMFLCLFFYLLFEYKLKIFETLKKNISKILLGILIFLVLIIPFSILIIYSNPDYMQRMGVYDVVFDDKIFLLKHYIEKLLRIKLIFFYIFLTLSYFFMKRFNKNNLKYIKVFYILFFSSILAPIIFILFSKKIAFLMHFNNMVVLCGGILIMMLVLLNTKYFLSLTKLKFNKNIYLYLIPLFLIFFYINTYDEYLKRLNSYNDDVGGPRKDNRIDRDNIIKLIESNQNAEAFSILTFDTRLMTWSILKGKNDLFLVDGSFSQRSHIEIENDIINAFKLMSLKEVDFKNFISNKREGYRYNNSKLKTFFWQKYTANSSYTFQKSKDFDKDTLNFIKKSSPYYIHQFVIPNFEIKRLLKNFKSFDKNNIQFPDYLIVNKNHTFFKNIDMKKKYCIGYKGKSLDVYLIKKMCS